MEADYYTRRRQRAMVGLGGTPVDTEVSTDSSKWTLDVYSMPPFSHTYNTHLDNTNL